MNDFKDRLRIKPLPERKPLDPERVMDALLRRVEDPAQLKRLQEKVSQALRIAEKSERNKKRESKAKEIEATLYGIEDRELTDFDWEILKTRIEISMGDIPQQDLKSLNRKRERLQGLLNVYNHCKAHGNKISFSQLRAFGFNSSNDCHACLHGQVTPNFSFRAQLKTSQGRSDEQFYYFTKIVPKPVEK